MLGGLALPDLFVGIVVGSAALCVIIFSIIYVIAHALIFEVLPSLQLIYGSLLLLDTAHSNQWLAYIPIFSHFENSHRSAVVVLGFLLVSTAWSNYFIGHATKPLVKRYHGMLVSFASILLWRAYDNGQCSTTFFACWDLNLVIIFSLGFCGLAVFCGNVIGPYIMSLLEGLKHDKVSPQ